MSDNWIIYVLMFLAVLCYFTGFLIADYLRDGISEKINSNSRMLEKNKIFNQLSVIVTAFHDSTDLSLRLSLAKEHIKLLKNKIYLFEHQDDSLIPVDKEVWKNIENFEGIYQVSNFGMIKSLEGFFIKNKKGGVEQMAVYKPEQIRSKRLSPLGYVRNSLWRNGLSEHHNVHRLVATYFVPNPKGYPQVLHIDDNPSNSHFKNLMWGTQSQNILDCVKKNRGFIGSKNGNSKLKETDIPKIRKMLADGLSSRKIGNNFGVDHFTILSIKHGKTWSQIK